MVLSINFSTCMKNLDSFSGDVVESTFYGILQAFRPIISYHLHKLMIHNQINVGRQMQVLAIY